MNMPNVISISKDPATFSKQFSVCTIVNDADEYALMQQTFIQNGFDADCEYLIADNTKGNQFDAYEAINHFIKKAIGKYIIIVHQDVRVIDNKVKLIDCLNELEDFDKNWAVCGNAGGVAYHENILYLIEGDTETLTKEKLPKRVRTLDENFLIIKSDAALSVSLDLEGFHLYGTDICLLAQIKGYGCYVIPFLVQHISKGNLKHLADYEHEFIETYGHKLDFGFIQTTCTRFYLSNSFKKNRFFNHPIVFFFVKRLYATKRAINKILKKDS